MITNLTIPIICFLSLLHSPSLLLYHQALDLNLPQPLNSILIPRPLKALFLYFPHPIPPPLFFPLETPISASSNPFITLLIAIPPAPPVLHRMNPLHHQLHVPSCDLYIHSS